jgi:hypothetical protein
MDSGKLHDFWCLWLCLKHYIRGKVHRMFVEELSVVNELLLNWCRFGARASILNIEGTEYIKNDNLVYTTVPGSL